MLFARNGYSDSLVIEGARVLDPVEGVDEALDVTIEDGVITRLEPARETRPNLVLAPAFVDPHVHLRTPGREDE
jgi:dihydroorotase